MNLLIFGKNGQLAQSLRDGLLDYPDIKAVFVSSQDVQLSEDYFIGCLDINRPDIVINCMAYTNVEGAEDDPDGADAINHRLPALLAKATHRYNCPFLHVSTDYVFDGQKNTPYHVDDIKNPLSVYGKTKSDGEDAVLRATNKAWILRTSWLYSIYGKNFFKTMFKLLQEKEQLQIVSDQIGAPTSAHQLAREILRVISNSKPLPFGVHHAVASGETSWFGFVKTIQELMKTYGVASKTEVLSIKADAYPTRAKRPLNSRMLSAYITLESWAVELEGVFTNYLKQTESK